MRAWRIAQCTVHALLFMRSVPRLVVELALALEQERLSIGVCGTKLVYAKGLRQEAAQTHTERERLSIGVCW